MWFCSGCRQPYHALRDIRTSTHGDDITSLGKESDLLWLKQKLEERYEIKYGGMLGPDTGDVLPNELNLKEGRAVSTPGTARTKTGDEKPLAGECVRQYRSLGQFSG